MDQANPNEVNIVLIETVAPASSKLIDRLNEMWVQDIKLEHVREGLPLRSGGSDLYVIPDNGAGQRAAAVAQETRSRGDYTPILIVSDQPPVGIAATLGKVEIVHQQAIDTWTFDRTMECTGCFSRWRAQDSKGPANFGRQLLDYHNTNARLEGQMADFIEMAESLDEAKIEAEIASQSAVQYAAQIETILHTAVDAILTISSEGHILQANKAAETLFCYTQAEVIGLDFHSIMPDMSLATLATLASANADGTQTIEQAASDSLHRNFSAEISVGENRLGDEVVYICIVRDITERERAQNAIRNLALKDPLTGLANRNLFSSRFNDAIEYAKRLESTVALLLIDLNLFKQVNDNFGHPVGDELLKEVAFRLLQATRGNDTVARLGGDEFAIVMVHLEDANIVNTLASRILESLITPYNIDGALINIGASIGIAFYPEDDVTPLELIQKADIALYQSKEQPQSNYQIYNKELQKRLRARKVLEDDLRLVIAREGLELNYQPQIDVKTGRICGVEALVRWRHPVRGNIPPLDFIPIAEASGLVIPLGELVLRKACKQGKIWQDKGLPLRIAVNFSVRQFRDDGILESVTNVLKETGFDPGLLELEITETVMIDDMDLIRIKLDAFRDIGVSLAIDDFGTGYSSLVYLKQLPIDRLKIDRAFVTEIPDDDQDIAILEAMARLAEALGVTAIAEGVENAEQAECLRNMGYHEIQGFHYGGPMSVEDLEDWIKEQDQKQLVHDFSEDAAIA